MAVSLGRFWPSVCSQSSSIGASRWSKTRRLVRMSTGDCFLPVVQMRQFLLMFQYSGPVRLAFRSSGSKEATSVGLVCEYSRGREKSVDEVTQAARFIDVEASETPVVSEQETVKTCQRHVVILEVIEKCATEMSFPSWRAHPLFCRTVTISRRRDARRPRYVPCFSANRLAL